MSFQGAYKKLGDKAYIVQNPLEDASNENDSDEEEHCVNTENLHMSALEYKYESSIYSSSSDESVSDRLSPVPDDANSKIFCYVLSIRYEFTFFFFHFISYQFSLPKLLIH